MIIGERFDGDLLCVQDMQHSLYFQIIGIIVKKARTRYLAALNVIDIDTQLGRDIINKTTFDHRTIQYMHDVIAARFRFIYKEYSHQFTLPNILGNLPFDALLECLWLDYYERFIDNLYENYPSFASIVLLATTYPNPNQLGIKAEEALCQLMKPYLPHKDMIMGDWETAY